MNEMMENLESIKNAIGVSLDPNASPQQRMDAYKVCEDFKESSIYLLPCGLLLSNKENEPRLRHYGLQLIEHFIKMRWNHIGDTDKVNLKSSVMQLATSGMLEYGSEPSYIKDGMSRLVVEIAKREWPQYWPSFIGDLRALTKTGVTQIEVVLLVFMRFVEDVIVFQNLPPKRRRDITLAFMQDMPDIFTDLSSLLNVYTTGFKDRKSSGVADEKEVNMYCHVSRSVLECFAAFLDWVQMTVVLSRDGILLQVFCILLGIEELQVAAAECLLMVVSRKGKVHEREALMVLFSEEGMATILRAATLASSHDTEEQSYLFLKKLCQILVELGKQLGVLWALNKKFKCPDNFSIYLQSLLTFTKHPSHALCQSTLLLWLNFTKHEFISVHEKFKAIFPELLAISCEKLKKVGYPSRADSQVCEYSRMDYDNDLEFTTHLSTSRSSFCSIIRFLSNKLPEETSAKMEEWLTDLQAKPIQTAYEGAESVPAFCDAHSPSYVEWDALSTFMDFAIVNLASLSPDKISLERRKELINKCLVSNSQDPQILSCMLSCVSACSPFFTTCSDALPQVFDKVFHCIEFSIEGVEADSQPRSVKLLRKHGCAVLVKLCKEYGSTVYKFLEILNRKVKELTSDNEQSSQIERVALLEALVLVGNHIHKYDKQLEFLQDILTEALVLWTNSLLQRALSNTTTFMSHIGLNVAPVAQNKKDTAGERRRKLGYALNAMTAVIRRCAVPEDPAVAKSGGYTSDSGPISLKNPSFELLSPIIPGLLSLMGTMNSVWDQNYRRKAHKSYGPVFELSDKEKLSLLGMEEQANELVVDRMEPVNRMRSFLLDAFEISYMFLGIMAKNHSYQFYSMDKIAILICEGVMDTLEHLPNYHLKHIIHHFLKVYISSCPQNLSEEAVLPVLMKFCPFMLQHLSSGWEVIQKRLLEIDDSEISEAEEALDEFLLRRVSREYIDFLVSSCIVTKTAATEDTMDMEGDGPRKGQEIDLTDFGRLIFKSQECYPHIVLSIFNSLSWPDTTVASRAIEMCLPIVVQMQSSDKVNDDLALYMMRAVLHGLEIHGKHETIEATFTSLAFHLYQHLAVSFPRVAELLKQIPGVDVELVDKYNVLISLPKHRMFSEKRRRELFKKITSKIIQVHTGQMFSRQIEIKDLPPIFTKKKRKMETEDDVSEEKLGIDELFDGAKDTEEVKDEVMDTSVE